MEFSNIYEDAKRAEAYSKLEFPGTYYLAYRDLPEIIASHVKRTNALDFGCGTGRSTRFLQRLGFTTVGVDISEEMLKKAREIDPKGDYRLIADGDFSQFNQKAFDLVLSAFTFDNIPTMEKKVKIFRELRNLLKSEGRLVNLVSSPEIYSHEWVSFSTKDFPANKHAKSGDQVRIIQTDTEDKRPVVDIIWTPEYYLETYKKAGLETIRIYRPLAQTNEPYRWVTETRIAPWTIYVLRSR
ncbi:MAG: class I SAM-dependent methyltransferase [Candidatus Bathyarchaeota archaeon]|nr:class I SAM-dependent methyltransferase [Candidatus Bathyarchaeota archaeon]MDH5732198.1 class I SAM-dependent methyltransferase [Candidatus Bathyarchaeota archaeon]